MEALKVQLEMKPQFLIGLPPKIAENIGFQLINGHPYMTYDTKETCLRVFHKFYCIPDGDEAPCDAVEFGTMVIKGKRHTYFYAGEVQLKFNCPLPSP